MAFQRPFLISLKRSDSSNRWGFGIKGGQDYGESLRIQSVLDDSLAERSGLREGDEIIQVGKVNVQDLTLGQVHELLARCGNRIEMFVVREDLLSPRKGKEPPVVKAVVHNPYNSPLSLYSTENIAETLAKQTEVLTEGQLSAEEDEGPESLSFKEKSAVFKLLAEQAKEEGGYTRQQSSQVRKPKTAPPPPPKPKPPSGEQYYNGYDSHQQVYQDQQRSNRVEYQTTQKVVNQYQYQQEQPVQYQQTTVYQTSSHQRAPEYQSPLRENYQEPGYQKTVTSYQTYQNQQPSATNYQQNTYQHQTQGYQSPTVTTKQQHPGYQSPSATTYQQLNQINYQQSQNYQSRAPSQQSQQTTYQQSNYQSQPSTQQQINYQQNQQQGNYLKSQQQTNQQQSQHQANYQNLKSNQQTNYQQSQQQTINQQAQQTNYQPPKPAQSPTAVSKAEFKIGPPPPPRSTSSKQDTSNMTAIYRQQYEQHLQKQYEQQVLMSNNIDEESKPKAHIIEGEIFEHNSTSGTPITYKAPPSAPPKPDWPPPPSSDQFRSPLPDCPSGSHNVASVWPPKKSSAVELPRTGFNPAAVREQGTGRRCVWPPPSEEYRSGRNTPQSPITGRRIQWNPSPSPPVTRKATFSPSHSPARRKDIAWPPPSPIGFNDKENIPRPSPKCTRKARFDDYIHEHASINVPQTYRPPPGTQHVEYH
ncbi:unnamed protein product [Larinioides sclopetarius]|uniref:PDZ domain-containing protein n=1 Tax=Larinioides sclopetarius TaxID=280406 RepID=A0AAV2APR9_9ARAC